DLLAGIAASNPLTGPALAIVNGEVTRRRERRFKRLVDEVGARIEELGEQVKQTYVQSEEFSDLFADAVERYIRIAQEAHRQKYADFMVGVAVQGIGSEAKARRVLRALDSIEPPALALLRRLSQPAHHTTEMGYGGPNTYQNYLDGLIAPLG